MELLQDIGRRARLSLLLATAVCAPPAAAGTVSLENGDKITGNIQKLANGKLTVDTAYAGAVEIAWDAVSALTGEGNFVIRTADGKVRTGGIERSDGKLTVVGSDGSQAIDIGEVAGFAAAAEKAKPTLQQKLKIGFDWGYNLTRGNASLTQSALGANAQYADAKQKLSGIASSIRSSQDNAATNRHAGDARYDRFFNKRLFAYGLGGLERNSRKLLALRTKLGGGFGLQLIRDEATTLSLLGGANYSRENYFADATAAPSRQQEIARNHGESTAGFELRTTRFGGIALSSRLLVFANLTDTGRYRFEYDGSIRLPVFKKFSYGLSFYDRYDSRPNVAVRKNDYGIISALGYTF